MNYCFVVDVVVVVAGGGGGGVCVCVCERERAQRERERGGRLSNMNDTCICLNDTQSRSSWLTSAGNLKFCKVHYSFFILHDGSNNCK